MEDVSVEEAGLENPAPPWFRTKAVAVHLYTASGAVLALLILVAAFQGEAVKALWLMLAALLFEMPEPDPLILGFSIFYLCYYFGLSLYLSAKMFEAHREQEATE